MIKANPLTQTIERTFVIGLIALSILAGLTLCGTGRGVKANAMASAAPRTAAAPIVTYNFTGYITYDRGNNPYPAGTEVTGTFSYDAGNPVANYFTDGQSAAYVSTPAYPMSMSIRVGTETWTSSDCVINLTNTIGNDHFSMIGHNTEGDYLTVRLRGPMFDSLALPTALAGAFDRDFTIDDVPAGGGAVGVLGGNLDPLSLPAPQPPAITVTSLTRTAGTPAAPAQIATVSDAEDAAGSLAVTANSATVNGVSLSGLALNSSGQVSAVVLPVARRPMPPSSCRSPTAAACLLKPRSTSRSRSTPRPRSVITPTPRSPWVAARPSPPPARLRIMPRSAASRRQRRALPAH